MSQTVIMLQSSILCALMDYYFTSGIKENAKCIHDIKLPNLFTIFRFLAFHSIDNYEM